MPAVAARAAVHPHARNRACHAKVTRAAARAELVRVPPLAASVGDVLGERRGGHSEQPFPTTPLSSGAVNFRQWTQPLLQWKPHERTFGPVMNNDLQGPPVISIRLANRVPRSFSLPATFSVICCTPPST